MLALNNKNCDIYIGAGSGTMIMNNIQNAEKSVKIISPYIEPEYLKILEQKYRDGLEVTLLTSSKTFQKSNKIYEFFRQTKNEDLNMKKNFKSLLWLSYILFATVFFYLAYLYLIKPEPRLIRSYSLNEVIGIFVLIILGIVFYKVAYRVKIYSYTYETTFPVYFYVNPYEDKRYSNSHFIHSKIYVIDGAVYLGSLNYTKSGFKNQIEARVVIRDIEVVEKFNALFNDLRSNQGVYYYNIDGLAKKYFSEPIN